MLVINNIEVSQNEDGLFSLTDIWRASGNKSKRPVNFAKTESFKDLIKFLRVRYLTPDIYQVVNGGNKGSSTYGCKEIVYAYAMYVDVKFMVSVIDAFDSLTKGDIDTAVKIAVRSVMINKAGSEFDRLTNDDNAVGEKAMNAHSNASNLYDKHSAIAGSDLASCRGKKAKRKASEDAIRKRSQLAMAI